MTNPPTTATISGRCTAGLANGPGVAGVTLYLDLTNNSKLDAGDPTAVTDANGVYSFTGLLPGNYIVRVSLPAGYKQISPLSGGIHINSLAAGQVKPAQWIVHVPPMVATPAVDVDPPSYPAAWQVQAGPRVYYSDAGLDTNDGLTPLTAKKTLTTAAANVATVLVGTVTIAAPITVQDGSWLGGDPAQPLPTLTTSFNGLWMFDWDPGLKSWTHANVNITSTPAIATNSVNVGNAKGARSAVLNVHLSNLNEGYDHGETDSIVIDGGSGVNVRGRSHYLESQTATVTWTGGTFGTGEAATQDPIRAEAVKGTIVGAVADQSKSSFGTAGFALHGAGPATIQDCGSIRAPFSFDTEGHEVGAGQVHDVQVVGLWVLDSNINVGGNGKLTQNTTFTAPYVENPGGTCVSLEGEGDGNVIDGGVFVSDRDHAIELYSASSMVVRNSTLYTSYEGAQLLAGKNTAANDGGGNKVVIVPKPAKAPANLIPAAAAAARAALPQVAV